MATKQQRRVERLNGPVLQEHRVLFERLFPAAEERVTLDRLSYVCCSWESFLHLVVDPGGPPTWTPNLSPHRYFDRAGQLRLANAYDRYQTERGDPRRAYRGKP